MRIGLGICGSIAAYRSVDFAKRLVAEGHEVRCFPTRAAREFVAPKALETVTGSAVASFDSFDGSHLGTEHIAAARWAEVFVIYGATAHFLGQLAAGLGPDFLTQQLLAFEGRVLLAPAMNPSMWRHPAVARNVGWLRQAGFEFTGPVHGRVACGETGEGHIASDSDILRALGDSTQLDAKMASAVEPSELVAGRRVLISAGPMRTALDPVRFVQNRSSGRMGLELARACRRAGAAKVTLLLGPVSIEMHQTIAREFEVADYQGAASYGQALEALWPDQDVFFSAAAVLDFEIEPAPAKIERERIAASSELTFSIRPVRDWVGWAARHRRPDQVVVAFAAESGTETEILARANRKMLKKGVHALIANPVWEGLGPEADRNLVWVMAPGASPVALGPAAKSDLSAPILGAVTALVKGLSGLGQDGRDGARTGSPEPAPAPSSH